MRALKEISQVDRAVSWSVKSQMRANGIKSYPVKCDHCSGEGRIETDNNGPIVDCPVCDGKGQYQLRVD